MYPTTGYTQPGLPRRRRRVSVAIDRAVIFRQAGKRRR
jgi:hypothetical protein